MGRAIDVDNRIDKLEAEIKTLKTAFKGLASTVDSLKDTAPAKKSVNLHKESDKSNVKAEGVKTKKDKKPELVAEET